MSRAESWGVACAWSALLLAAAVHPSDAQQATVSDSAGVKIVQHVAGAPQPQWRVDPEPEVVIGMVDGPTEYLLFNPRMATVLSDGTIVIQDSYNRDFGIRYYEPDGTHILTASRLGEGPFEFGAATVVAPIGGDSVLALGYRTGKYGVFGPRGEHGRDGRLLEYPKLQAIMGTFLSPTRMATLQFISEGRMPPPGIQRTRAHVVLVDMERDRADTLALVEVDGTGYIEEMTDRVGVRYYPYPYAAGLQIAVGHDRVWVGGSDRPELRAYDAEGRLTTILRLPPEPNAVTRDEERAARDRMRNSAPESQRGAYNRIAGDVDLPDNEPFFQHLAATRDGGVWVQRYELADAEGPQWWDVFSADGKRVAEVRVPAELVSKYARRFRSPLNEILEIGADYVLLAGHGEFDERRVTRHRLIKH